MLKMGKTEHNGVDPQDLIDRYGADTARLFVMFASPPEQTLDWNDAGVEGAHRFLRGSGSSPPSTPTRSTRRRRARQPRGQAPALRREVHSVLRQVSYDYERMQYNTVVSGAMKLLNALEAHAGDGTATPAALREGFGILLRVLYPVCPHTTWALWNELGYAAELGGLLDAPWPQVDERALVQDEIELMLQVNGKLRGTIRVAADADKAHDRGGGAGQRPSSPSFAEGRPAKKVDRRARPAGQHRRLMRAPRLAARRRGSRSPAAASSSRAARAALQDDPADRLRAALAARRRAEARTSTPARRRSVVEAAKDAQVVLQALGEAREKSRRRRDRGRTRSASSSCALRFSFRVRTRRPARS